MTIDRFALSESRLTKQTAPTPSRRRTLVAVAGVAAALLLGGCAATRSAESPAVAPPTSAATTPAPGSPLTVDELAASTVVQPGEWGVVRIGQGSGSQTSTSLIAVLITSVTLGRPGALDQANGAARAELLRTGTPVYINYRWSPLAGGGQADPLAGITAWSERAQVAATPVVVDASLRKCPEQPSPAGSTDIERTGCAVAVFAGAPRTADEVRFTDPSGSHEGTPVRFELSKKS